jgi:hypothetical protein
MTEIPVRGIDKYRQRDGHKSRRNQPDSPAPPKVRSDRCKKLLEIQELLSELQVEMTIACVIRGPDCGEEFAKELCTQLIGMENIARSSKNRKQKLETDPKPAPAGNRPRGNLKIEKQGT